MTIAQYLNAVIDPCMAAFFCIAIVQVIRGKKKDTRSAWLLVGILITGLLLNALETLTYLFAANMSEEAPAFIGASSIFSLIFLYILVALETEYLWRKTKLEGGTENSMLRIVGLSFCGIGMAAVFLYGIVHVPFWLYLLILDLALMPLFIQTVLNRGVFYGRAFWAYLSLSLLPALVEIFHYSVDWGASLYIIAVSVSILIIYTTYRRETSENTKVMIDQPLTNQNIFLVFDGLDRFMMSFDMEKMNRFKVRMTIEEVLLRMQEKFGEEETFSAFAFVSNGRPQIRIEKAGKMFNPFSQDEEEAQNWSGTVLTSIGLNPVYSYAGGKNIVKLSLQRLEMNPALKIMIALFIGLVAGYMCTHVLSSADQELISQGVLRPIYDMMRNLLYCVTGPILFLMVGTVILDAARISEQGGSSRNIVSRYLILSFLMGLVPVALVLSVMGRRLIDTALGKGSTGTLLNGLLSIIPDNVFSPFVEANTPQLMVMAIMCGLAVAVVGSKAPVLADGIRQANMAGMQMAQWIGIIIPYLSIPMAALICLTNHVHDMIILAPVLLGAVVITLLCMAAVLLYVSFRRDVRPAVLIRKCWPSFVNSLKSGSLETSYALSERCCTADFGIESRFAKLGLPLGIVMYMPANVVGTLMFIMYAAIRSGVTISPLWLLLSVILAVVLFIATPPIPGANFLAYIVMISMLGINEDFLMMALIYEIIYGTFASPANQFFVQMEMILQAKQVGLVKEDVLRREKKKK